MSLRASVSSPPCRFAGCHVVHVVFGALLGSCLPTMHEDPAMLTSGVLGLAVLWCRKGEHRAPGLACALYGEKASSCFVLKGMDFLRSHICAMSSLTPTYVRVYVEWFSVDIMCQASYSGKCQGCCAVPKCTPANSQPCDGNQQGLKSYGSSKFQNMRKAIVSSAATTKSIAPAIYISMFHVYVGFKSIIA